MHVPKVVNMESVRNQVPETKRVRKIHNPKVLETERARKKSKHKIVRNWKGQKNLKQDKTDVYTMVTIIPTEGATDRPKKCGRSNASIYAGIGVTTFYKFVFSLDLNRQFWKKVNAVEKSLLFLLFISDIFLKILAFKPLKSIFLLI